MDPADKKKADLEKDPDMVKLIKSMKMKVPMLNLYQKVKAEGRFQMEDVLLFASDGQKSELGKIMAADAPKPKSADELALEKKVRMERMAKAKEDKANKAPRELTMLEQI